MARNPQVSALSQGFGRSHTLSQPPSLPAPRRSVDHRREPPSLPPQVSTALSPMPTSDDFDGMTPTDSGLISGVSAADFPDATQANRRAPRYKQRPFQIPTDYDTRLFAVCVEYICTSGYITKAWTMRTGACLLQMEHREGVKISSIIFKPTPKIEDEGKRIWLGTNIGEIHEVDIPSQRLVKTRAGAHSRREIIRIFRHVSDLWTLDDGGDLHVWRPDQTGMPSLDAQSQVWKVPKGHTFSIACGRHLWIATGKDIRIFLPGAHSDAEFQVLRSPLSQKGTGDVTAGATLSGQRKLVFFGHSDGKVSIYNRDDFSCVGVANVSMYKISSLAGVGEYLWAGYSTGMVYVYDTSTSPWSVKKGWQAHDRQVCSIIADSTALWKMGRLHVITLGIDNLLRIWDGYLADDWLETHMEQHDSEFCSFQEITTAVLTWNAGASKPSWLSQNKEDNAFFRNYLTAHDQPDIFVFGFQELVDLEDKKLTAKTLFKSKRKDANEQEHMSHQYRAWRDHLARSLDEHLPLSQRYMLLHTSSMVGLFTCIFVRDRCRDRIRCVHTAEIKRGMGGRYGNKGALVVRLVLDDSSICLVNCHLAAGQSQTVSRNNDAAAILEAACLPAHPLSESEAAQHEDVFAAGGDGSMITDHEICILHGDLNYRIDAMGRDTVVRAVAQNDFAKLLSRDQLLLSRKKNPGFRLRAFQESPITFAPTYKYNPRTDEYDTSEKRRAPAWCDRILYRGKGKVKMLEYRRWDGIRVSDHRPVSGTLLLRVKKVDARRRAVVMERVSKEFDRIRQGIARAAELEYLTNILGLSQKDAAAALRG